MISKQTLQLFKREYRVSQQMHVLTRKRVRGLSISALHGIQYNWPFIRSYIYMPKSQLYNKLGPIELFLLSNPYIFYIIDARLKRGNHRRHDIMRSLYKTHASVFDNIIMRFDFFTYHFRESENEEIKKYKDSIINDLYNEIPYIFKLAINGKFEPYLEWIESVAYDKEIRHSPKIEAIEL